LRETVAPGCPIKRLQRERCGNGGFRPAH
jgi:hypothetical protein